MAAGHWPHAPTPCLWAQPQGGLWTSGGGEDGRKSHGGRAPGQASTNAPSLGGTCSVSF